MDVSWDPRELVSVCMESNNTLDTISDGWVIMLITIFYKRPTFIHIFVGGKENPTFSNS